jgi:hydrogenase 3 maturation protease
MCKVYWHNNLSQTLKQLQSKLPDNRLAKIAVVGIGNELCGDDAAGVTIARALQPHENDRLLIIDAGPAPENCTGPIRRFDPDLVLLVDAAQMDETPGTVCCVAWQDTTGFGASTHTLPPYVLAQYLMTTLECDVALVGIQPVSMGYDEPCSPEVNRAIDSVVEKLAEMLI